MKEALAHKLQKASRVEGPTIAQWICLRAYNSAVHDSNPKYTFYPFSIIFDIDCVEKINKKTQSLANILKRNK